MPSIPKLHAFLLMFLTGVGIPNTEVSCGCSDPLFPSIAADSIQGVVVQWFHPQAYADTLRLSGGRFDRAFGVGDDYHDHLLAIRIPDGAAGRLIHSVTAYFVAGEGVPAGLWASEASFAWTIRRDSSGQPGSMIGPEQLWDLGMDSTLRGGGWRTGLIDILLPDTAQGAHWLVGRWPETARGIVFLGAETGFSELPVMIGFKDDQELSQWVPISQPRLLVELEFLSTRDQDDVETSEGGWSDAATVAFKVLTAIIDGPGAPGVDTAFVLLPSALRFRDEPGVGQTLEYSVRAICGGESSAWVHAGRWTVGPSWDVSVRPDSIIAQLEAGSEGSFVVSLTNHGQEPVVVRFDGPIFLRGKDLTSSDSVEIRAEPESLVVSSGVTAKLRLIALTDYTALGSYSGAVGLKIAPADRYPLDNHLVFLEIEIGMQTWVGDPFPDHSSGIGPNSGLNVRAVTNPFADEIVLLVSIPGYGANVNEIKGLMESNGIYSEGEAALYNILGQELARLVIPVDGGFFPATIGEDVRMTFSGTRHWPSGVYFCRVRWGNKQRTVQLVHVR